MCRSFPTGPHDRPKRRHSSAGPSPDRPGEQFIFGFALLFGLALSVVTAFGIAPDVATSNLSLTLVRDPVDLPELQPAAEQTQRYVSQERVMRGDTVAALFDRLGVSDRKALEFLKTDATGKMIFRQLVPGRMLQAETGIDGELLALRYFVSASSLLEANRTPAGIKTRARAIPDEARLVYKSANLRPSALGAAGAAGIPGA